MLQLSYSYLKVDPLTLAGVTDPTHYDAAYYAITCSEYGEGTADGRALVHAPFRDARNGLLRKREPASP